jgi:hypothetical protein
LERLLGTLKESNSGTFITLDHKIVDGNKAIFGRAFWVFGVSINGFQYYCPLISINNTHLYGKYKAKLLVTIAYDVNNGVYLLCYDMKRLIVIEVGLQICFGNV